MRDAIADQIITLPEHLRRSLARDQGAEMAQLTIKAGLPVYFCDPQSPWQRGTNENTNGLLRQYFPRGVDLARHSAEDLAAVAGRSTAGRARRWAEDAAAALDEYLVAAARPPLRPERTPSQLLLTHCTLLRGPVAPKQYTNIRYGERLAEIGAVASIETVGDSHDNALAETLNGYHKTELIRGPARSAPWKTVEEVELATRG